MPWADTRGGTQPGPVGGWRDTLAGSGWGGYPGSKVPPLAGYPPTPSRVPLARSGWGGTKVGYPPQGTCPPWPGQDRGTQPGQGGTQVGYPQQGTPQPGWGYPGRVPPRQDTPLPGQVRMGGTQLGQQKEYSLHGGRYASCVHAGGLSCLHRL